MYKLCLKRSKKKNEKKFKEQKKNLEVEKEREWRIIILKCYCELNEGHAEDMKIVYIYLCVVRRSMQN